jgi:hypothetical protein
MSSQPHIDEEMLTTVPKERYPIRGLHNNAHDMYASKSQQRDILVESSEPLKRVQAEAADVGMLLHLSCDAIDPAFSYIWYALLNEYI